MRSIPNPCARKVPNMALDISSLLLSVLANVPADAPMTQAEVIQAKRSAATHRCRDRKAAKREKMLAAAGGDPDSLKVITLWCERTHRTDKQGNEVKIKEQLFAKGYDKHFVGVLRDKNGDDEAHDQKGMKAIASVNGTEAVYEVDATDWVLRDEVIVRARPPKEEITNAQFEGRYLGENIKQHGGASFYAATPLVRYAARPNDNYAKLGDFEWADRDEVTERENQMSRSLNALRAARPIRNIKEAKA